MGVTLEESSSRTSRRALLIGAGALASTGALIGQGRAAAQGSLAASALAFRTIEPDDENYDDLAPFADAVGDARIVQLGECSHGSGTCFKAKVRLVKFLHAQMGFDVLVWESGLHAMGEVNAGFRAGQDAVAAGQRGVFAIWSAAAEVKPLFDCAKVSQPSTRPREMAGFHCQFTARGADQTLATALRAFVQKLREPAVRAVAEADVEVAVATYAKVASRTATDTDLRSAEAAVDRLLAEMSHRHGAFERVYAPREIAFMTRALESLRVFTDLTFETIPGPPGAVAAQAKDPTRFFNRREAQNARNLRWLIDEGYPGRKIIVWAHNVHVINAAFEPDFAALRREPRTGDMAPMGLSVARWFGGEVYTVGLTSFSGEDRWVTSKAAVTLIPPAGPGSLEDQLHQLRRPYLFLNTRDLGQAERRQLGMRVFVPSPGSPVQSPDGLFPGPDVVAAFDGVLFIDQARAATSLQA